MTDRSTLVTWSNVAIYVGFTVLFKISPVLFAVTGTLAVGAAGSWFLYFYLKRIDA